MGLKIKKSPKPASNQKKPSNVTKTVISSSKKKAHASPVVKRLQKDKDSLKKATLSKKVVRPDTLDTSRCELEITQVCRKKLICCFSKFI